MDGVYAVPALPGLYIRQNVPLIFFSLSNKKQVFSLPAYPFPFLWIQRACTVERTWLSPPFVPDLRISGRRLTYRRVWKMFFSFIRTRHCQKPPSEVELKGAILQKSDDFGSELDGWNFLVRCKCRREVLICGYSEINVVENTGLEKWFCSWT